MKVFRIDECFDNPLVDEIRALERLSIYPLGKDAFCLDHGSDYFAFFRRLGKLRYYTVRDKNRLAAVGAGVLRSVTPKSSQKPRLCWYLCDLKVHPDFRGQHIPLKLLSKVFLMNYLRCQRAYAISMNSSSGTNRIAKMLKKFRWLPFRNHGTLWIYSMDVDRINHTRLLLEKYLGEICFLSLEGKKDLVLQSNGKRLPLLHLQYGELNNIQANDIVINNPRPQHIHMFCLPEGHPLIATLKSEKIEPDASATIIAHGMGGCDWRFIRTSDI